MLRLQASAGREPAEPLIYSANKPAPCPGRQKPLLENARQLVHLTGKANFPCSRLAGGPVPQDRRKRFNRRFPERRGKAAGCPQFSGLVTKSTAPALCKSRSNSPASPLLSTSGVRRGLAGMIPRAGTRGSCRAVLSMAEYVEVSRALFP